MEDFYYFPGSLETASNIRTVSPVVSSSLRNRSSPPSPKPHHVPHDAAGKLRHHYLDACFRCERTISGNKDIFMYRGDTPFCSEECRQQQIDTDEAIEKGPMQSAAARREQQRQRQSLRGIPVWAR